MFVYYYICNTHAYIYKAWLGGVYTTYVLWNIAYIINLNIIYDHHYMYVARVSGSKS